MATTLVNITSGQTFLHKLKQIAAVMPELTVTKSTAIVTYYGKDAVLAEQHHSGDIMRVEEQAFKAVMTSIKDDAVEAVAGKLRRSL